jgi:hypothetical protein
MISDDDLYRLAIFLGCTAMLLIVVYHFLEVNVPSSQKAVTGKTTQKAGGQVAR